MTATPSQSDSATRSGPGADSPIRLPFDNSYARLPERFHARMAPQPVAEPGLIRVNHALAAELGLDPALLESPAGIATLAGNRIAEGSEPLAMAYAGHQFGGWVPQLGDGRAILLGEVIDIHGQRRDIQLKGSGRTPFSRGGDGRAPLGPVIREYLVCEAMAALGVPTTRALAAVTTGERVVRETILPGAVLARVASSHIRVGTFQFFYARQDIDGLRLLADHVIARHDPDIAGAPDPYAALLERVVGRQALLVARWMGLGFIHGVMNTDNMTVSGETIDYGPCAFMDAFHPETVFSSIDRMGRYQYRNQPGIAQWNLAQFAQTLLPLIAGDETASLATAQAAIDAFPARFGDAWLDVMRRKLGLERAEESDLALAEGLLEAMAAGGADFTATFRALADLATGGSGPKARFADPAAFETWAEAWRARIDREDADRDAIALRLRTANPVYIPRNHLIEEAIQAAMAGDLQPFEALLAVLSRPFDEQPGHERYAEPAAPEEAVLETFCGT